MFIPNPNSENIFVFDNVADFAEAVRRFVRGVNVFWKSGTTYDMMTSYVGGALVGAKYTVDASGASETPGGGGAAALVVHATPEGNGARLDKTYSEIVSAAAVGACVVLVMGDGTFLGCSTLIAVGNTTGNNSVTFNVNGQVTEFRATTENDYPATVGGDVG